MTSKTVQGVNVKRCKACVRRRLKTVSNLAVSEEYKDAKLEECSLPIQQYFAALDVGVREDLLLRGDAGTGKTYAACAVAMAYVAKHTVRFVTMPYFCVR